MRARPTCQSAIPPPWLPRTPGETQSTHRRISRCQSPQNDEKVRNRCDQTAKVGASLPLLRYILRTKKTPPHHRERHDCQEPPSTASDTRPFPVGTHEDRTDRFRKEPPVVARGHRGPRPALRPPGAAIQLADRSRKKHDRRSAGGAAELPPGHLQGSGLLHHHDGGTDPQSAGPRLHRGDDFKSGPFLRVERSRGNRSSLHRHLSTDPQTLLLRPLDPFDGRTRALVRNSGR